MKQLKMLGSAVLVALMVMAFVGASSASAGTTALCNADETPCAEANIITHVHEVSVGKAKLLSSVEVECNVSFLGDALAGLVTNGPVRIHGTFIYTNCGSCEVEEENGPAEVKVLRTGHETGTVVGEGLVTVICPGFIECSFNGVGLEGAAKGPLLATQVNGEVVILGKVTNKEKGGFLCPATSKLDMTTTPEGATLKVECKEVTDPGKTYITT